MHKGSSLLKGEKMKVEVIKVPPKAHPACIDNRTEIVKLKADIEKVKQENLDAAQLLTQLEQRIGQLEAK